MHAEDRRLAFQRPDERDWQEHEHAHQEITQARSSHRQRPATDDKPRSDHGECDHGPTDVERCLRPGSRRRVEVPCDRTEERVASRRHGVRSKRCAAALEGEDRVARARRERRAVARPGDQSRHEGHKSGDDCDVEKREGPQPVPPAPLLDEVDDKEDAEEDGSHEAVVGRVVERDRERDACENGREDAASRAQIEQCRDLKDEHPELHEAVVARARAGEHPWAEHRRVRDISAGGRVKAEPVQQNVDGERRNHEAPEQEEVLCCGEAHDVVEAPGDEWYEQI